MEAELRLLRRWRGVILLIALAVVPLHCSAIPVGPRRWSAAAARSTSARAENMRAVLPTSVAQEEGDPPGETTNSTVSSIESVVPVVPFPSEQPAQTRQQIMSFLLYNSTFTKAINNATVDCLSNGTRTDETDWGLWAYKRFSSDMTQLEYFCNVRDAIADGQFANWLKEYLDPDQVDSGLTDCVARKDVGLGFGKFFMGREAEERQDLEHDSTESGGSPLWIPGLIIGLVGLICLVAALVLAKQTGGRKYQPNDYDDVEQDEVVTNKLSSEDELRMMADGT